MTTHEQHTLTDSPEEAAVPVSEAPRIEDESTAVAPEPVPAADSVEPAAESVEPGIDSAEPSIDTTAPPSAEVPEAEPPSAKHESSADELLFAGDDLADLRARWAGVQAAFVDDPKECVQKADGLVSDLVEHLTTGFAEARSRLEEQWSRGEEASTEDLRLALMHYREFFERLLAV
ncbi:MAG: hypothetical protein QOE48_401 [Mycobacterium sp.]|jgi:hypothetical protein|nr:hypothetical protein [Mycobacterium sp.]